MPWKNFINTGMYKQYERIVFRHLRCKRVPTTMALLDDYVRKNIGKKYGFNIWNLFKQKIPANEDKKYFCSELVASAYMAMGILPNNISANSYLPVSFSADQQLNWKGGATLGQEYLIKI